ncbi:MAG: TrkH family potassium uptake protein [Methanocalculus sp.]|uniref:TrkH family potassium uptake protein n=1 Tax=Methanocalculus sp. TaxID=2004547 RepID=UPI002717BCF1|nr:TrkH family potassium uptake protein [Methanocalculus sp.]MDO9539069.1 TrkH family potassium uptake protein [Methanocalculus sp.]
MDRMEHFSIIARDIGGILQFMAFGSSAPLIISIIYAEWDAFLPMALVPIIFFILGSLLRMAPHSNKQARLSVALSAVALIWLIASFIGAIPFYLVAGMPFIDSVFEAMSGWTTTGLTLASDLDDFPKTLLFWRSLMQWLGGMGIVAFTVAMVNRSGLVQRGLYRSEARSEAFMPSVVDTGAQMWKIYIVLTLAGIGLVMLSGVGLWESLNLTLVAIATGGFTMHDAGIAYYDNPFLELLLIPVMIAGALPFKLYFMLYAKRIFWFFRDLQAVLLFAIIASGIFFVSFDLINILGMSIPDSIRYGLFMTVSAATTTGFQNTNPGLWPHATVLFLAALMIIGGASGSTAGGIKLGRALICYDGLVWWFRRIFVSGRAVIPFRHEGRSIPKMIAEYEVSKNMLVIVLYFIIVFMSTILILQFEGHGYDTSHVIFDVITAACNNGISTGHISPDMSDLSKVTFIFLMWLGRLEVLPIIVLIVGIVKGFERT